MKSFIILDFASIKFKTKEVEISKIPQLDIANFILSINGTSNFELWYKMLLIINLYLVIGKITVQEAVEYGKLLSYVATQDKLLSTIVHFWRRKPESLFQQYNEIIDNVNFYFCNKYLNDDCKRFWSKRMFEILNENSISVFCINKKEIYMSEFAYKYRNHMFDNYINYQIGNTNISYQHLFRCKSFIDGFHENRVYGVMLNVLFKRLSSEIGDNCIYEDELISLHYLKGSTVNDIHSFINERYSSISKNYIKKWFKHNGLVEPNINEIIDMIDKDKSSIENASIIINNGVQINVEKLLSIINNKLRV